MSGNAPEAFAAAAPPTIGRITLLSFVSSVTAVAVVPLIDAMPEKFVPITMPN